MLVVVVDVVVASVIAVGVSFALLGPFCRLLGVLRICFSGVCLIVIVIAIAIAVAIAVAVFIFSALPVLFVKPGSIASHSPPHRSSLVGCRSLLQLGDVEAMGAVRRVAILSGPSASTAHSLWGHRGHRAAGKSHRRG